MEGVVDLPLDVVRVISGGVISKELCELIFIHILLRLDTSWLPAMISRRPPLNGNNRTGPAPAWCMVPGT